MLAENLVDLPYPQKLENQTLQTNQSSHPEVAEENINTSNSGAQQSEGVPEAHQLELGSPGASHADTDDLGELNDIFCTIKDVIFVIICFDTFFLYRWYGSGHWLWELGWRTGKPFHFFFVNYSNVMFFLWICFQYLVIHESYWYMWLVQDDDEQTIDEDEALITEVERNEELAALQAEADLPLEDVLKTYKKETEGDLLQWFFFYPLSYVDRNNAMHFLTVGTQKIIWSVEYFSASRESSPDSKGINSNLDSKNLIVGEITQNLHSIKTDYFEVFSFAFLVIGVDFFPFFRCFKPG
jgi:hypothetical protein